MKGRKQFGSFILIFLFLFTSCTPSLKNDQALVSGSLSNGLNYLIYPNAYPKNLVTLRLVLRVGSLMEDEKQQGIAHFTEHMLFNGTKSFPHHSLITFLESQGMRFGADLNAYTSFDQTVYQLDIQNPQKAETESLRTAFKIMREWLRYVSFDKMDIEKERGIILQEKLLHEGFSQRYSSSILQSLYKGTIFSDRLPIGKEELIKSFNQEDFLGFYNRWYRPQRASIVICGDNLDVQEIKKLIEQQFGDLENAEELDRSAVAVKVEQLKNNLEQLQQPYKPNTFISFTDKELKNTSLLMVQRIASSKSVCNPLSDESLLQQSLMWLFERRFKEILDKTTPLPYQRALMGEDLMAGYLYSKPVMANVLHVDLYQGREKEGLCVFFQEIERLRRFGFTQGEWKLCQQSLLQEANREYDNRQRRSSVDLARQLVALSLEETSVFASPEETLNCLKSFFERCTLKTVNKAIHKILSANEWLYFYSYSLDTHSLLTEQEILAMKQKAGSLNLDPYIFEESCQLSGRTFEKVNSLPKVELISTSSGFYRWTLDNGIRVYFKPNSQIPKAVSVRASALGLIGLKNAQHWKEVCLGAELVNESGWGKLTRSQTQQFLLDKNLSLVTTYHLDGRDILGHFDWEAKDYFFECLWSLVRAAKIEESSLEEFKQNIKEAVLREQKDYKAPFRRSIKKALYADNPFVFGLRELKERIETLDLAKVLSFYQEQFNDLRAFDFIFVGDIDQDELIGLTARYLGAIDIRKTEGKEEIKDYLPYAKRAYKQKLQLDPEERATAFVCFTNNHQTNRSSLKEQEENILLQALELAYSRTLIDEVREKISGVYGISFTIIDRLSQTLSSKSAVQVSYVSSPEQLQQVTQAVKEVIQQGQKAGFSSQVVDYLRKYLIKTYKKLYEENTYWLDYAIMQCLYGGDWQHKDIESYVQLINCKNLKEQAQKLISWDTLKEVYLLPKGKE